MPNSQPSIATVPVTKADRDLWKFILDAPFSTCSRIDNLPDDCPELQEIARHRQAAQSPSTGSDELVSRQALMAEARKMWVLAAATLERDALLHGLTDDEQDVMIGAVLNAAERQATLNAIATPDTGVCHDVSRAEPRPEDLLLRSEVVALCERKAADLAGLVLESDEAGFADSARQREAMEATATKLRHAIAQMPAATPDTDRVAVLDIVAERQRQIESEGWTPEHDDEHDDGSLADAAAAYALNGTGHYANAVEVWPWSRSWWKPKSKREDLVRAGALIVAEIERLDRAALSQPLGSQETAKTRLAQEEYRALKGGDDSPELPE